MRQVLSGIAAIALMGVAGAADADTTSGVIGSVNWTKHMITLSNGQMFELGTGIRSDALQPGDQVVIEHHFFEKGYPLAESVTKYENGKRTRLPETMNVQQSAAAVESMTEGAGNKSEGVVSEVDFASHRFSLTSGRKFEMGDGIKSADLEPGDRVVIEHDDFEKGYPVAEQITKYKNGKKVVLPGR